MSQETLEHEPLANLGYTMQDCDSDYFDIIVEELGRRVEHDRHKALVLFDYHVASFRKLPSTEHWNQLTAIMALVQHYAAGCPRTA